MGPVSVAPDCPFCGSRRVERVGQWGGQMITAQWRCHACHSYFEAIREDFDDPAPADPRNPARRSDP
jgi:transposase-like protein